MMNDVGIVYDVCQMNISWHLEETKELIKMVEGLGEEIYPLDVFPRPTVEDIKNMMEVEKMFPNLLARVDSSACRRAFNIAARRIRELEEET